MTSSAVIHAFSAYTQRSVTSFSVGNVTVFDSVVTNANSGYSTSDGVFVCPCTGKKDKITYEKISVLSEHSHPCYV